MRSTSPVSFALLWVILVSTFVGVDGRPATATTSYDAAIDLTFPVVGETRFIDDYHQCRGGTGCPRIHRATDIMAPYGRAVHAAMGGTVTFITGIDAPVPGYGYMIAIRGDDGRTYNYIHLGRQELGPSEAYAPGIEHGVRVERGQHIGTNGCSGNASCDAPHLHFEVVDDTVDDPHGSHRMNPYASLVAALERGDVPGSVTPVPDLDASPGPAPTPSPDPDPPPSDADPAPDPAPTPTPPSGSQRFVDVDRDDVHDGAIGWLADRGVTLGCNAPANDRFCPGDPVSRQQMAAFLVRTLELPVGDGRTFVDVPADSPFRDDIDRLATAGITVGCNAPVNDRFCPRDRVSRMQTASFLTRAFALPEGDARFVDVEPTSVHAPAISSLATAGVTVGCNRPVNDRFCPTQQVTRAQFASFLRRAVELR